LTKCDATVASVTVKRFEAAPGGLLQTRRIGLRVPNELDRGLDGAVSALLWAGEGG
jgi:hypothetical protein